MDSTKSLRKMKMATKKAPPLVYQVLEKVSRARTSKTKLGHLEKYDSPALRTILLLNYHPEMKFVEFHGTSRVPQN